MVLLLVAALLILRPWEDPSGRDGGPATARAFVVRAVDGDTIEVRIGQRLEDVRYIGVDTPETVKPGTPVQCFGPRASAFEHRVAEGRRVRLVTGVEPRDGAAARADGARDWSPARKPTRTGRCFDAFA